MGKLLSKIQVDWSKVNRWSVAGVVSNILAAGSETFRPVLRVRPAALDPSRRELSKDIKFWRRAVRICSEIGTNKAARF